MCIVKYGIVLRVSRVLKIDLAILFGNPPLLDEIWPKVREIPIEVTMSGTSKFP